MNAGPDARVRSTLVALVAVAGALVGHVVGYGVVARQVGSVHHYLSPAAMVSLPLAAGALLAIAWRFSQVFVVDIRAERRTLTAAMVAVYACLEVGERIAVGHSPELSEAIPVIAGLVAQPLIAWLLIAAAGTAGRVLEAWTVRPALTMAQRGPLAVPIPVRVEVRPPTIRRPTSRGPPVR